MIEILGPTGNEEYRAAKDLAALLREWDPQLEARHDKRASIVVRAKCPGGQPSELDLLLLLWREGSAIFPPIGTYRGKAAVEFLCLGIEVKSHPLHRVRFQGLEPIVEYDGREDYVLEQVRSYPHTLKRYLRDSGVVEAPFVAAVAWLRNVPMAEIPGARSQSCVLGSDADFEDVLVAALLDGWPVEVTAGGPTANCASQNAAAVAKRIRDRFAEVRRPTPIDRKRLEAVSARWLDDQRYGAELGTKMLLIRGAPGTGKTVALLRIARDLIRDRGCRVAFLTYNNALVSDLRRHLALEPQRWYLPGNQPGLRIQTVNSFMADVARAAGVEAHHQSGASYDERYSALKQEMIKYLDAGMGPDILSSDEHRFDVDFVLVDEGQDWPPDECSIMRRLFGHKRLIVAVGESQLMRQSVPADWTAGLPKGSYNQTTLRKVRRLTAPLCDFANAFKEAVGIETEVMEPDRTLSGGRIVVVLGQYLDDRALQDELTRSLRENGNELIDTLFLVPPGESHRSPDGRFGSRASVVLGEWGYPVWDGVDRTVRRTPPADVHQTRIVNYQSARGLEGWLVVALGLDSYFDYLLRQEDQELGPGELLESREHQVRISALRKLLIPITRAVHTLILEVRDPRHEIVQLLQGARDLCGEIVEWRVVEGA